MDELINRLNEMLVVVTDIRALANDVVNSCITVDAGTAAREELARNLKDSSVFVKIKRFESLCLEVTEISRKYSTAQLAQSSANLKLKESIAKKSSSSTTESLSASFPEALSVLHRQSKRRKIIDTTSTTTTITSSDSFSFADGYLAQLTTPIFKISKLKTNRALRFILEEIFEGMIMFTSEVSPFTVSKIAVWGLDERLLLSISDNLQEDQFLRIRSRHHLYQSISANINQAILYYQSKYSKEMVLHKLIALIVSYKGLFTDECRGCKSILHHESESVYMPCVARHLDFLHPYHSTCLRSLTA